MIQILFILLFSMNAWAGLPPTATQGSGDSSLATTFNFVFPNMDLTHTGTKITAGKLYVPGGGTGLSTLTSNGILFGNGTSPLGVTAAGTTGSVLKATTGAAPSWGSVNLSADVSNILPLANGGTNANIIASAGGIMYSTASAISVGPVGTANTLLHSNGAAAPTWSKVDLANDVTGTLSNSNTTGTPNKTANTLVLRAADASFSAATVSGDVLALPTTTASVGQVTLNGNRFLNGYNGNTFLGDSSGNFTATSSTTTAMGFQSMQAISSGIGNACVGYQCLKSVTTADANAGLGYQVLLNTTGPNNVGIGNQALKANTTGSSNVAIGKFAMINSTSGAQNTAVGSTALQGNISGDNNTAIGNVAMMNTQGGTSNTGIGDTAFRDLNGGSFNACIGYFCGVTGTSANATTTGTKNTFLGYRTGQGVATQLTRATAIGSDAVVNTSNTIVLGISGDKTGVGTPNPALPLSVNGAVQVSGDSTTCSSTTAGGIRYNSAALEFCNGTTWATIDAAAAAASANTVLAGPTSGAAATPTMRSLVRADLPATVKLHVYDTSGTAYPNGPTDVTFNTSVTDSNSAFSSSKIFTVPTGEGGWYGITASLQMTGVVNSGQEITLYAVCSTGGTYILDRISYDNASLRTFTVRGHLELQLVAGETVKLQLQTTTAGSQTLVPTSKTNYLSITKLSP